MLPPRCSGGVRVDQLWRPPTINPPPSRVYYLYLMLPAIIVLACITIYPFFWLIWMSLHDVDVGAASDKWNDFRELDPAHPRPQVP